jgi:glycyl-tRNA synthetase beta chain
MIPTGSSDPFALRRAANGIVNITWSADLALNLNQLLQQGAADFVSAHSDRASPLTALQEFFLQRIRTLLQDEKQVDYDLINAVVGDNDPEYAERALEDLLDVRDRALFLQSTRDNGKLNEIYETINRSARLASKGDLDTQALDPQGLVNPELFAESSEPEFYQALVDLLPQTETAQHQRNYQSLIDGLAKIAPIVSNFFDGDNSVLVMADNPDIKRNRLNFLGLLRNHARVLADFGAIVKG